MAKKAEFLVSTVPQMEAQLHSEISYVQSLQNSYGHHDDGSKNSVTIEHMKSPSVTEPSFGQSNPMQNTSLGVRIDVPTKQRGMRNLRD